MTDTGVRYRCCRHGGRRRFVLRDSRDEQCAQLRMRLIPTYRCAAALTERLILNDDLDESANEPIFFRILDVASLQCASRDLLAGGVEERCSQIASIARTRPSDMIYAVHDTT